MQYGNCTGGKIVTQQIEKFSAERFRDCKKEFLQSFGDIFDLLKRFYDISDQAGQEIIPVTSSAALSISILSLLMFSTIW